MTFCSNNPVNLPDRARAQISADTGNRQLNVLHICSDEQQCQARAQTDAKGGNSCLTCKGAYSNIHVEGAEWYRLGQLDDMPRREFTKRK